MQHHNFLHESVWQDCTKSHPWTWATASLVPCFLQLSSAHIHLKCHAADVCSIDWLYSSICMLILFPKHGDVGDSPDAHHKNTMVLQLFPHCTNWNWKVWALYSGSAVKMRKEPSFSTGTDQDLICLGWIGGTSGTPDMIIIRIPRVLCYAIDYTLHQVLDWSDGYIRLNLCRLDLVGRLD